MNKVLSAILRGVWLMEPGEAQSYLPAIINMLKGISPVLSESQPQLPYLIESIVSAGSGGEGSSGKQNGGAIGVVTISGPIMKYDNCGDLGTETIGMYISKLDNNPNIGAIILKIYSPGGTVDGTQTLANIIKGTTKPVIAYVDDMAASAAMWIASAADEIIANVPTAIVGSIGTMITFADMKPAMEKEGIVLHEIYADKSKDKNGVLKAALEGNYKPIKEQLLNPINEEFISTIKTNRAGKLDLKKEDVLTGKTYLAKDAIAYGLVDSIGDFTHAITRARELSANKNNNHTSANLSNPNTMKFKSAWKAIGAFFTSKNIEAKEGETEIKAEHIEEMDAELTRLSGSVSDLQSRLNTATESLATAQAEVAALTADKASLSAEVATLKAGPGADVIVPDATEDPKTVSSIADPASDHNKIAEDYLGK